MASDRVKTIQIRKRPWYIWLSRVAWIAWLAFWAEVAFGSWKEFERRAFAISLAVFVISLLLGTGIWLKGRLKFKRDSSS